MRRLLVWVIVCLWPAGCALMGPAVRLSYHPSKNALGEKKTSIALSEFVDRRKDLSLGRAAGIFRLPLRPNRDVIGWVREAAAAEMKASGYKIDPGSEWKLGGVLEELSCGSERRIVCRARIELWLKGKDGWAVIKRKYEGEGARPPLLPEEDPRELSLDEALRDALVKFRRDVELAAP